MSTPTLIIGEHAIFQRLLKKGKPSGKPMLVGYMIDFSTRLNTSMQTSQRITRSMRSTPRRSRRKTVTSLQTLTNFTASYSDATESVELLFTGQPTFKNGGRITVLGGPLNGVMGLAGAFVSGNRTLTISSGGKNIMPA